MGRARGEKRLFVSLMRRVERTMPHFYLVVGVDNSGLIFEGDGICLLKLFAGDTVTSSGGLIKEPPTGSILYEGGE